MAFAVILEIAPEAEKIYGLFQDIKIDNRYDVAAAYRQYKAKLPEDLELSNAILNEVFHAITLPQANTTSHKGAFLSCLAEKVDGNVVIDSRNSFARGRVPDYFGIFNEKNIEVRGHADDYLGVYQKENGFIHVTGEAIDNLGAHMSGGEIIVDGKARQYIGNYMSGGKIRVGGESWDYLGDYMTGGEITVNGDACRPIGREMGAGAKIYLNGRTNPRAISPDAMGEIYHKNELVWKGGKKVA